MLGAMNSIKIRAKVTFTGHVSADLWNWTSGKRNFWLSFKVTVTSYIFSDASRMRVDWMAPAARNT